jgi:hypothetical protein
VAGVVRTPKSRGEQPAADWIGARINDCAGETVGRFNRTKEELDLIEAGTGHVTLVGCDEVAEVMEAGGWWALCETFGDHKPGFSPHDLELGYFQTEAEAKAAAARHVAEAGDREGPPPGWLTQ